MTNKAEDMTVFSKEKDHPKKTKAIDNESIIGIFQHVDQLNGNGISCSFTNFS